MIRLGAFLTAHPALLVRLHRYAHRTADKACWVCRAVWAVIAARPDFSAALREGEADLAAGRTVCYRADEL